MMMLLNLSVWAASQLKIGKTVELNCQVGSEVVGEGKQTGRFHQLDTLYD